MNQKQKKTLKTAFENSLPVMAGYLVLGMAFGILLEKNGYGCIWAFCMSLFIYAGSMQFAAVGLLSSGASLISAALMTLLINARHLVYGISMLKKYENTGRAKPYLMFSLTDETYALLCTPEPEGTDPKFYDLAVSVLDQIYWVTGSVAGSLIGSALQFDTAGIDFAMTALFLVIFVQQWISTEDHAPAWIGILSSVICRILFGASGFLIPSMIVIVSGLLILNAFRRRPV